MAKKQIELTSAQMQACEHGFEQAEERGYISRNSSRKEIDNNIYEILEFGCDEVDDIFPTDNELDAAVDYIYNNMCN